MYAIQLYPIHGTGGGYFSKIKHAETRRFGRDYNVPVCTIEVLPETKTWKNLNSAQRFAKSLVGRISEPNVNIQTGHEGLYHCRFNIYVVDLDTGYTEYRIKNTYWG